MDNLAVISIRGNKALTRVAFPALEQTELQTIAVSDNPLLTDVDLKAVAVTSTVELDNNDRLEHVGGLSGLRRIRQYLRIRNNDALTSLNGLFQVTSLGGVLPATSTVLTITGNARLP